MALPCRSHSNAAIQIPSKELLHYLEQRPCATSPINQFDEGFESGLQHSLILAPYWKSYTLPACLGPRDSAMWKFAYMMAVAADLVISPCRPRKYRAVINDAATTRADFKSPCIVVEPGPFDFEPLYVQLASRSVYHVDLFTSAEDVRSVDMTLSSPRLHVDISSSSVSHHIRSCLTNGITARVLFLPDDRNRTCWNVIIRPWQGQSTGQYICS